MKNKRRGFTLIELLVVVLIIGILSAIALPQYTMAVEKARLAEALQNASSLRKAVDLYILENDYQSYNISFLGNKNNGHGLLGIDLESNLDCTQNFGSECVSKYFHYYAYCTSQYCSITSEKLRGEKHHGAYWIQWYKGKEDDEWTPTCYYNSDEFNEDEKICKALVPDYAREDGCC